MHEESYESHIGVVAGEMNDSVKREKPSWILRLIGTGVVIAGAALALWLRQPGWVFLVVAGIIIYHGGRLPKPHR
jgi:hypothetical protein